MQNECKVGKKHDFVLKYGLNSHVVPCDDIMVKGKMCGFYLTLEQLFYTAAVCTESNTKAQHGP